MFAPKADEEAVHLKILHSKKLHYFLSSPYIRVVKKGRLGWALNVARMKRKCIQVFGDRA
jgi:hypothetical protein